MHLLGPEPRTHLARVMNAIRHLQTDRTMTIAVRGRKASAQLNCLTSAGTRRHGKLTPGGAVLRNGPNRRTMRQALRHCVRLRRDRRIYTCSAKSFWSVSIMPIFRAREKLVLYAHVPKCGGSSVAWYLSERFGPIAFSDAFHTRRAPAARWSKTSPQHIDKASLGRLFPDGFFDAVFTIVRHPVDRILSAYHFQLEIEKSITAQVEFSDWLADLEERRAENPFVYDNHMRPMAEIVPEGAKVFYMEHGLDALVPWFDQLTGTVAAPRAIPRMNERKGGKDKAPARQLSQPDLDCIGRIYAEDFARFGYSLGSKMPQSPAPELTPAQIAERDAALRAFRSPVAQLTRKIGRRIGL
jgi:hypothetical protein